MWPPDEQEWVKTCRNTSWRWYHTQDTLQLHSVMELTLTRSPHCSGLWLWLWSTAWHLHGSTPVITCNLKLWQSDFKESDFRATSRLGVLLCPGTTTTAPVCLSITNDLRGHSDPSSVPRQADMITAVWIYSAASEQCARCVGEKKRSVHVWYVCALQISFSSLIKAARLMDFGDWGMYSFIIKTLFHSKLS